MEHFGASGAIFGQYWGNVEAYWTFAELEGPGRPSMLQEALGARVARRLAEAQDRSRDKSKLSRKDQNRIQLDDEIERRKSEGGDGLVITEQAQSTL